MPIDQYFKGDGRRVYADMLRRYGAKRGKGVFYATANARGLAPKRKKRVRKKRA